MKRCKRLSVLIAGHMLVGTLGGLALAVAAPTAAQEQDCTCGDDGDWERSGSVLAPKKSNDQIGIGLPANALAAKFHLRTSGATRGMTVETEKRNAITARSVKANGVNASGESFGVSARGGRSGPGASGILAGGVRGIGLNGSPGVFGTSVTGIGVRGATSNGPAIVVVSEGGIDFPDDLADAAIIGEHKGIGHGVYGDSLHGVGVFGESVDAAGMAGLSVNDAGVTGSSTNSAGVLGTSKDQPGVSGQSVNGVGLSGKSENGDGVSGFTEHGTGVVGRSNSGIGVIGESSSDDGVVGSSKAAAGVAGFSGASDGVFGKSEEGSGVSAVSAGGPALSLLSTTGNLIDGGAAFRVANNGDVFVSSVKVHSDARSKTDIVPVGLVLERLARIRTVYFRRTGVGEPAADAQRQIGVLGQDVEAAFPELVASWNVDNQIAVDYVGLTAVLLSAVRELQVENAELKARLAAVEEFVAPR